MKRTQLTGILFFFLFGCLPMVQAQQAGQEKASVRKVVEPLFSPPARYQGMWGEYRSPLLFNDGRQVKTAEEWSLRRKEIRDQWMQLMGEWPEFVSDNRLIYVDSLKKEDYTEYKVRLLWTPTEYTTAYLLVPAGIKGKKPAVITTFYEPETAIGKGKPKRDFALQLVRRGFVTLSIGTTEASGLKTYSLFYPSIHNARVQPLSMLAYAAANAWRALAREEAVDSTRIGIVGHSFGGKWAMFASCLYDKFACAVWSDPAIVFDETSVNANYWEPYYLGYHAPPWRKRGMITPDNPASGLYVQLRQQGRDLHELHALMAPRPFLVSGGSDDPEEHWVALNHTVEINRLLGYKNRVAMSSREKHEPSELSNLQLCSFFEYFLKQ